MIDYKASNLKNFVSGIRTGSTVFHVNLYKLTTFSPRSRFALHSALRSRVQAFGSACFLAEFIILAMPRLLSMTLFAEAPGALSLLPLVPMFVLFFLPPIERGTPSPAENWDELALPNGRSRADIAPTYLPQSLRSLPADYLCSHDVNDNSVYTRCWCSSVPSILAKCETYGVSLMDIGVGSFMFFQGVVSVIPIIKDISYIQALILPKLESVSRNMIPIIVLGILRVVLTKGTEYPEHVTEYGVHWNFFFTLALLPIIEVLLHPIILRIQLLCWVFGLKFVMHQLALSSGGMKDFLLNASQSNIIFANKEGLLSLLDITHYSCYVSIHILGLSSGTVILPPSPSSFWKQQRQLLNANICYVLWVAAYNTSFILDCILLDMMFFPTRTSKIRDPTDPSGKRLLVGDEGPKSSAPALLEASNKNGLILFLLSNVATGLINLDIQTIFVSNMKGMYLLCACFMGMCVFAWLCRRKQLWEM
ncbi:hypothetical protein BDR06DRAFT_979997 [Suillus hirtellus]|nr:hypothetical protein BDR06DRAFT_979997 [Suillus hirtellus]